MFRKFVPVAVVCLYLLRNVGKNSVKFTELSCLENGCNSTHQAQAFEILWVRNPGHRASVFHILYFAPTGHLDTQNLCPILA
jgi:hypothetical protein